MRRSLTQRLDAGAPLPILACFILILGGCSGPAGGDGEPDDADIADGSATDLDADPDEVIDADEDREDDGGDSGADADAETVVDGDADEDGEVDLDADPDEEIDADEDGEDDLDADPDEEIDADEELDGDVDGGEPPMEPLFAFAVIADPHVTGSGDHADRLAAAVAWINDHTPERGIEVVLVLGDICWGGGMELARDILDELAAPYVPIIGDNEVHAGDAERFQTVFSDQYELLSETFEGWQRAETPAWNPVTSEENWFTNVAFDLRGVHFVAVDWAPRAGGGIAGEMGEIHDFEGGTWPWFVEVIEELPKEVSESIVLASHIPMHALAFTFGGIPAITGLLGPYGDAVYADFAGHVHVTYEMPVRAGGYHVYVTDATHDDENTVRVVHVEGDGRRFAYTHDLIAVE